MAAVMPLPQCCTQNGRQKPPVEPGVRTCGTLTVGPVEVPTVSRISNSHASRPGTSAYQSSRPLACEEHGVSCQSRVADDAETGRSATAVHCSTVSRSRPPGDAFGPPFASQPQRIPSGWSAGPCPPRLTPGAPAISAGTPTAAAAAGRPLAGRRRLLAGASARIGLASNKSDYNGNSSQRLSSSSAPVVFCQTPVNPAPT